ncbi:acyl-CoA dehydrogenase family protein [Elusimicrobiota bacterium]
MNFELTEDQKLIRETAREFAEKRLKKLAGKFDEEEEISKEVYQEAAELGFFGMLAPEEFSGLALDSVSYIAAMEELARGSASFQVGLSVHNSLTCGAIVKYGNDPQKKKYLEKLAKGEMMGAYSLTEPSSGTDAGSLKCSAVLKGDSYILNGTKSWVTNAGLADIFVVFVSTNKDVGSKGISCLLVDKGLEGFTISAKEKKMGMRGSDTREISFQDCKVPKGALLGEENKGFKIALNLLDSGRIGIAAQAIGIAQAAYEEALSYAKTREQFGKQLADFQAIQFKLADMALQIDAARLLLYRAAAKSDTGVRFSQEASMAKLFASEIANKITYQAVQVHGALGYSRESAVERYYRDARVTEIYEGTSEAQRMVIAREILK